MTLTTTTKPRTFHDLTHHSLAEFLPLMEGEEFDALVKDIEDKGLREPITLYEDKILDGRNRYRAVVKAKLQYKLKEENFRPYTGSDPLGFVVSANLHRRHLTESQRATIAATLVTTKLGDNQFNKPGVTNKQAAQMLGVSEATVKVAKDVAAKAAPEINQMVQNGKLRLASAKEIIKKPKEEQVAELKRIEDERAAAKAAKRATKGTTSTKTKEPKANQAMKDVDDFKAKWQSFDEMQRKAFVMWCEKELAELLEYVRQQQAMAGGATEAKAA